MDAFLSRCSQIFGPDWIIVFLRNVESSLYRNDSTFLKNTIIQSGPKNWLHLYKEMIPHFLRKQCFHLKCVLFRQCNQYGIYSISVIDATLWIQLQLGKANLYRINCIGQAEWLLGSFTAKLPKTWSMFERRLHFHWEIEMVDSDREKTLTLVRFNWSLQTIFGPRHIECSIKMEMRYSMLLFDHAYVDTSSYMAGFHIGPLYWSISANRMQGFVPKFLWNHLICPLNILLYSFTSWKTQQTCHSLTRCIRSVPDYPAVLWLA